MFRDTNNEPQTYEEMIDRYRASAKRLKLREPSKPVKPVIKTAPPKPPEPEPEPCPIRRMIRPASVDGIARAAERLEKDLKAPPNIMPPRARAIVNMVAEMRNIDVRWLCGSTRVHAIVEARHELYWRLYREGAGEWSMPQIARWLGKKDHTTVLHGIKQASLRMGDVYAPRSGEVA